MGKLLIIGAAIALVALVALIVLGYRSQAGEAAGLVDGRLQSCPDTPNCVNSEFSSDVEHYIEPLRYSAAQASQVLPGLKRVIRDMGGVVQVETDNYLAVTFTSPLFRFVDDLEIRIDAGQNTAHLRSASRVGRSDLGANRKRVQRMKDLFLAETA